MSKRIPLEGKIIGKLTVFEYIGSGKYRCQCDCGNVVEIASKILLQNQRRGNMPSCGCTKKPANLDGQKFNKLTVIGISDERNTYGQMLYRCRCECGAEVMASASNLKRGEIKACGKCTHIVRAIDITGQRFGRLVAVKRTERKSGSSYIWECKCDCGNTCYVTAQALHTDNTRSCGCLHRESLPNLFLDHVNMAKFEQRNSGKKRSTNTSGATGVYWDKRRKLWAAEISFRGKRYHLGRYADFDEAVKARKAAEEKLYDDFLQWHNDHCKK